MVNITLDGIVAAVLALYGRGSDDPLKDVRLDDLVNAGGMRPHIQSALRPDDVDLLMLRGVAAWSLTALMGGQYGPANITCDPAHRSLIDFVDGLATVDGPLAWSSYDVDADTTLTELRRRVAQLAERHPSDRRRDHLEEILAIVADVGGIAFPPRMINPITWRRERHLGRVLRCRPGRTSGETLFDIRLESGHEIEWMRKFDDWSYLYAVPGTEVMVTMRGATAAHPGYVGEIAEAQRRDALGIDPLGRRIPRRYREYQSVRINRSVQGLPAGVEGEVLIEGAGVSTVYFPGDFGTLRCRNDLLERIDTTAR